MGFPRTPFLTVAEDLPLYRQSRLPRTFFVRGSFLFERETVSSANAAHGNSQDKAQQAQRHKYIPPKGIEPLHQRLAVAQLGDSKPLMKWFYPFGRYVFVPLCLLCLILGIAMGGIG